MTLKSYIILQFSAMNFSESVQKLLCKLFLSRHGLIPPGDSDVMMKVDTKIRKKYIL